MSMLFSLAALYTRDERKNDNVIIIGDDGNYYGIRTDYRALLEVMAEVQALFCVPEVNLSLEELELLASSYVRHKQIE